MTSLLGHAFRKQALQRYFRVLGGSSFNKAASFTREKANATLRRYNHMAYAH